MKVQIHTIYEFEVQRAESYDKAAEKAKQYYDEMVLTPPSWRQQGPVVWLDTWTAGVKIIDINDPD